MKNKAFSVAETIILLTVLAVAIAATTPIVTKKLVNVADAGSTITGGSHGRYEIFTKEIISIPPSIGDYEKTTTPPKGPSKVFGGGKDSDIIVFRRLHDEEYIKVLNITPVLSKNGKYKSTLYEQINDVTVTRNNAGQIEFVQFNHEGTVKKFPVGGNIVVENANLVYKKGCLDKTSNPKQFVLHGNKKPDGSTCNAFGSGAVELPNDNNRLIEGNYAAKVNSITLNTNILWHVEVADKTVEHVPAFEVEVTPIPWEKIYTGNNPIKDEPIKPTIVGGKEEYVGTFDPGDKAINVVVHAVGGGGAGGGLKQSDLLSYRTPSSTGEAEIIKKELAKRFRENATTDELKSLSDNDIVNIKNTSNGSLIGTNYPLGKYWLEINTADNTITGKVDVRNGSIFPHKIFKYTKVLGSEVQKAQIYEMPEWFTWKTIGDGGFYAGATACSGSGGSGSSMQWIGSGQAEKPPCYVVAGSSSSSCTGGYDEKTGACLGTTYYCTSDSTMDSSIFACDPNGASYTGSSPCPDSWYDCYPNDWQKAPVVTYTGGSGGSGTCGSACTPVNEITKEVVLTQSCSDGSEAGSGTCANGASLGMCAYSDDYVQHKCAGYGDGGSGEAGVAIAGSKQVMVMGGTGGKSVKRQMVALTFEEGFFQNVPAEQIADALIAASNFIKMSATAKYENFGQEMVRSMIDSGVSDNAANVIADNYILDSTGKGLGYFYYANIGLNRSLVIDAKAADALLSVVNANNSKATKAVIKDGMGDFPLSCATQLAGDDTGKDGSAGEVSGPECTHMDGIGSGAGLYNHIYTWTIPYMTNRLAYGEAGKAGEYKTTKISKVDKVLHIKLGKGGAWDISSDKWKNATQGLDGTDTVVKMGDNYSSAKTILTAKGGKGGTHSKITDKYDLCYGKKDTDTSILTCARDAQRTDCCNSEKGMRSTRDIVSTALNLSAFENIKSLVGNSLVIGTGSGRGGEGAGSRADYEAVYGDRYAVNVSGSGITGNNAIVYLNKNKEKVYNSSARYQNKAVNPSDLNFRGGDGAVIITW